MAVLGQGENDSGRLSLDQLIALNDEIAALARSGMPLERGLIEVGRDVSGRTGRVAASLGTRLSEGQSLEAALDAEGENIPKLYRAVVRAGVKAGRLTVALEGLAGYARSYAESRRMIGLALWYPLIVFTLAFVLFVFLVTQVVPKFQDAFESLQLPVHASVTALSWLGARARYWWPLLPVCLGLAALMWIRSGHSGSLRAGPAGSPLRWFPWMGSMLANFEAANFAELLALLLEHNVPFPGAISLCAEASDDPRVVETCQALAADIERGTSPGEALREATGLPPLLRWLLATGTHQGDLVRALRQMASFYRRKGHFQAEKARVLLPTMMLCVIGVSATLFYALTLFLPFSTLLREIAQG